MPELPEVETMRRGILGIEGSQIADVERCACKLKRILIRPRIDVFRRRAVGRTVEKVDRIGKRVVVRLDNGDAIIFEPRMTGLVLVADPPNIEHLRFCMRLTSGDVQKVWYWDRRGLGSVCLYSADELDELIHGGTFGPDALSVTAEVLRERFGQSRREVKVALLDQKAVAGIGNLYASEILHLAKIHPQRRCDQLTREQWAAVQKYTVEVLQTAIEHEGSTLSDGTYRNALNKEGGYQNQHRVYDREGELCPTCDEKKIVRIVQCQRSTFFCPRCQARRRRKG